MKWKLLGVLSAILIGVGSVVPALPVWANGSDEEQQQQQTTNCGGDFLGFRPWYQGLTEADCKTLVKVSEKGEGMHLSTFIWTAVLNVVFDISLAAGYIAVGLVIYGGYLYMMSQGDPGKMARGKKTLMSAIIGLVITMGATVLVNTAKVILGINSNSWQQNTGGFQAAQLKSIFDWAYLAAGIVAVAFIIMNGINYMTSVGDPGKVQKATRGVIVSVIGLIIVILAAAITNFVVKAIGGQ